MTQLAQRLWQCRRDGGNVEVANNEAPKTLEEALASLNKDCDKRGKPFCAPWSYLEMGVEICIIASGSRYITRTVSTKEAEVDEGSAPA